VALFHHRADGAADEAEAQVRVVAVAEVVVEAKAETSPAMTKITNRKVDKSFEIYLALYQAISSTDDKWLRTLSAEQKLFGGPVSITGSVSETAAGDISKSLKAGFKRSW